MSKDLTKTDLLEKYEKYAQWVEQESPAFSEDRTEDQEERLEKAEGDFRYYCKTYFPHYFTDEFSEKHNSLFEAVEGRDREYFFEIFPRDAGKDAIVTVAGITWAILFRKRKFISVFSYAKNQAGIHTSTVKAELEKNARISHDFPMLRVSGGIYEYTAKSTKVIARGSGQEFRGMRHGSARPDMAVLTDYEKGKVKSKGPIQDAYDYIKSDIFFALDPSDGVIIYLQNLYSRKGVLAQFLREDLDQKPSQIPYATEIEKTKDSKHLHLVPALIENEDGDYESYWYDHETTEQLLREKREEPHFFDKEKMHSPRHESDWFRDEMFRYYRKTQLDFQDGCHIMGFDPSFKAKKTSDYKAIIDTWFSFEEVRLYVFYAWVRKTTLPKAISALLTRYKMYRPRVIK